MTHSANQPPDDDLPDAWRLGQARAQEALRAGWDAGTELEALWKGVDATSPHRALGSQAKRGVIVGDPGRRALRPEFFNPGPASIDKRQTSALVIHRSVRLLALGGLAIILIAFNLVYRRMQQSPELVHRYQTAFGQRSTIPLAQGSVMILAPQTTAELIAGTVILNGEAYFSITPGAVHPMTVRTRNAVVQILGTRFVVRQYLTEQESRVVVEEGKVALRSVLGHVSSADRSVLSARMLGRVSDSSVTVTSGVTVDDYTAWTRGRLVFDLVPLGEVLADLARAYNAEIHLSDSTLARQVVTATVSTQTQPLVAVLDGLTQAIGAHVKRVGNAFVIGPGMTSPKIARPILSSRMETSYGR